VLHISAQVDIQDSVESFSLASVIRNEAVAGLPKGGKNRFDSAPERPQVAFSAGGHGYPHGQSTRAQCNAVCAISVTTGSVNRSSDFGRRKMHQAIVLDRQNGKQ
jgi:hypothetical protein